MENVGKLQISPDKVSAKILGEIVTCMKPASEMTYTVLGR